MKPDNEVEAGRRFLFGVKGAGEKPVHVPPVAYELLPVVNAGTHRLLLRLVLHSWNGGLEDQGITQRPGGGIDGIFAQKRTMRRHAHPLFGEKRLDLHFMGGMRKTFSPLSRPLPRPGARLYFIMGMDSFRDHAAASAVAKTGRPRFRQARPSG